MQWKVLHYAITLKASLADKGQNGKDYYKIKL